MITADKQRFQINMIDFNRRRTVNMKIILENRRWSLNCRRVTSTPIVYGPVRWTYHIASIHVHCVQ